MKPLRKWSRGARWALELCLPLLALSLSGRAEASGLRHRFEVLSTRIEVNLGVSAKVTQCRPDGRGFVVSLTGASADQLRRAFRQWRPDPLLSELRVEGDSTSTEPTLVLSFGAASPRATVRAEVKRGKLAIVARLVAPATSMYYTEAGAYLARHDRLREALAQFRKAIALEPDNARAYLEAARVRAKLGQKSLAIFNAKKAAQDVHLRGDALALLARLDPRTWGRVRHSGRKAERSSASEPVGATEAGAAPMVRADTTASAISPASLKTGSGKTKPSDNALAEGATSRPRPLAGPSEDALSIHSTEKAETVEPFSIPGNAWAFVLALGVALLFTAPLTWLLMRRTNARPRNPASPFVRVPASTPPLDDFQRLLAERTGALAAQGRSEHEETKQPLEGVVESVLRTIEEKEQSLVETPEAGFSEEKLFAGNDWARLQRDFRVELESAVALADRGLTADEIARRIGLGREEVRLVLAMSRAKLGHLTGPRARERGLSLTFAE